MTAIEGSTTGGSAARTMNLLLGAWLFLSGFLWDHGAAQRTNAWVVGALCAAFAAIATSVASARWLNTALAVWLFASVWALPHNSVATTWNDALVAIAVFLLSLVRGGEERAPAQALTAR